jgi:hypothetical protein
MRVEYFVSDEDTQGHGVENDSRRDHHKHVANTSESSLSIRRVITSGAEIYPVHHNTNSGNTFLSLAVKQTSLKIMAK